MKIIYLSPAPAPAGCVWRGAHPPKNENSGVLNDKKE